MKAEQPLADLAELIRERPAIGAVLQVTGKRGTAPRLELAIEASHHFFGFKRVLCGGVYGISSSIVSHGQQLLFQRQARAEQARPHRVEGQPQQAGDFGVTQLLVLAQHQNFAIGLL